MINKSKNLNLAIIGLGYVGLPLAIEFAKKKTVIGFDINEERVKELNSGKDKNLEITKEELQDIKQLNFTSNQEDLKSANCFIITVPTPIDKFKKPDLLPLMKASEIVALIIKNGDLVIYESTVYPGCVEEQCVPVLEKFSKLKFNQDFFCGYSPERINPGDKEHTVSNIKKITSGSTAEIADLVDDLYNEIIKAGTHKAPSIKVAEAAKVIENSQRDINIAFVNELSKIFRRLDIDTKAVLEAAGTKWNFLKFSPGLVGGHCIGVDPYYLAQKAIEAGYNPDIILAGRKMNDSMGSYVATETIKIMIDKGATIKGSNALVLGITFKENCPDIRNSRVIDIIDELKSYHVNVDVYDPWASKEEVQHEYELDLKSEFKELKSNYDAIILAVSHKEFLEMSLDGLKSKNCVIFDVKSLLPLDVVDARL